MELPSLHGHYYIQQVADITGLSKQLIRKWETRYELIHPQRLDNGYRVYSEMDVNVLLHVKALVDQGQSVKQASEAVKAEQQSHSLERMTGNLDTTEFVEMNDFVLRLLEKGANCDEQEVNYLLQQAHHHYGLEHFLDDVIIPFMREVGNRWESGQWDAYQESLVSFAVRDYLIQIRRNFKYKEDAPLVLGACLPYELHEMPVHLLLLHAMLKGWKTILLGSSPAPGSIELFVEKAKPRIVLLSVSTTLPFENDPEQLIRLDQFAKTHPETAFYIGGPGIHMYEGIELQSISIKNRLNDIDAFSSPFRMNT